MTICFQYARQRQIFYVRAWRYSEYMPSSDCLFVITGKFCNSGLIKILQSRVLVLATLDTASKINKKKNLLEF